MIRSYVSGLSLDEKMMLVYMFVDSLTDHELGYLMGELLRKAPSRMIPCLVESLDKESIMGLAAALPPETKASCRAMMETFIKALE